MKLIRVLILLLRRQSNCPAGDGCTRYLALWSCLSAPWTPGQRSAPGRTPGPGASGGTWQLAPPAVGRCLRMGWEQRLRRSNKDMKHLKSTTSALLPSTVGGFEPKIDLEFVSVHEWNRYFPPLTRANSEPSVHCMKSQLIPLLPVTNKRCCFTVLCCRLQEEIKTFIYTTNRVTELQQLRTVCLNLPEIPDG